MTDRIITLIDMDCFFCQVETRINPSLAGLPVAVIQYNSFNRGGIVAVSYEARDRGVTRFMQKDEAKKQCPDLILVSVPSHNDRANLSRYRDAGREVADVICMFSDCVQRASVDEAYVDLTPLVEERFIHYSQFSMDNLKNTYIVGYSSNTLNDEMERRGGTKSWLENIDSIQNTASQKLAVGAVIVEEIREAIFQKTGFKCSAGIAHNKILAKLACGFHKPNKQTVLPHESVEELFKTLPIKKVRNLGGKLGDDIIENLGCQVMENLLKFSKKDLQSKYDEKTGNWLYNIARGYDYENVSVRLLPKSIGCCKKFPGRSSLSTDDEVNFWLNKIGDDLYNRLLEDETMNKRKAHLLTISVQVEKDKKHITISKSAPLIYNFEKIISSAYNLLRRSCHIKPEAKNWSQPIVYLGLSASKFSKNTNITINTFFKTSHDTSIKIKNDGPSERDVDLQKHSSLINESIFDSILESSGLKFTPWNGSCEDKNQEQITNIETKGDDEMNPVSLKGRKTCVKNEVKKNTSISSFFSDSSNHRLWIQPEELFPDLNEVDTELLSCLPLSYRNKIVELQKEKNIKASENEIMYPRNIDKETKIDVRDAEHQTNEVIKPFTELQKDDDDFTLICSECGESFPKTDFEIHMDMHIAQKLDKELNSAPNQRSHFNLKKDFMSKNFKRRSKLIFSKLPTNSKKQKIDIFFKKETL